MIRKLEEKIHNMSLSCLTPKELYYLILALKELEFYKIIVGEKDVDVIVSTLSPEDYD